MKKVLVIGLILLCFVFESFVFRSEVFGALNMVELKDQLKLILAQGEPVFTDSILYDFLILSVQAVSAHGFAYSSGRSRKCSTTTFDYDFAKVGDPSYWAKGQGLFISGMTIDEGEGSHRSIWEIEGNALGQKELVNPPAYQYYYIWHKADTSFFHFYDIPDSKDSVTLFFYFVPTTFYCPSSPICWITVPDYFEAPILQYALYFCYTRIKAWDLAYKSLEFYRVSLSTIREFHVNRPHDMMFGVEEIER